MLRLCLDRVPPPGYDRLVTFELPKVVSPKDASTAFAVILASLRETVELVDVVGAYVHARRRIRRDPGRLAEARL